MTEPEWLTSDRPLAMLRHLLPLRHEDRLFRLVACACLRRLWPLADRAGREAVEAAEAFAQGRADRRRLERAFRAAERAAQRTWVEWQAGQASDPAMQVSFHARDAAGSSGREAALAACSTLVGTMKLIPSAEAAVLVREVFGDPTREAQLPAHWRTWNEGTIPRLARHAHEGGHYDELPVLGDALEEAGCVDRPLLEHCRSAAGHVAGCWVLRLLAAE